MRDQRRRLRVLAGHELAVAHGERLPVRRSFEQGTEFAQPRLESEGHDGGEAHRLFRNIDFVEEGFDLAIRLGLPQDSRLVARQLEDASLGVFAAPSYLERKGRPKTIADLKRHDCIQFVLPSTGRPMPWLFREGGEDTERSFAGQVRIHDDVLGCINYARAGGGLFQIYHFIAHNAVRAKELVEVLKSCAGRSRPFSILYRQNRHLSARVRAIVDFLLSELARKTRGAPQSRLMPLDMQVNACI